jgi:hypothetical protein
MLFTVTVNLYVSSSFSFSAKNQNSLELGKKLLRLLWQGLQNVLSIGSRPTLWWDVTPIFRVKDRAKQESGMRQAVSSQRAVLATCQIYSWSDPDRTAY